MWWSKVCLFMDVANKSGRHIHPVRSIGKWTIEPLLLIAITATVTVAIVTVFGVIVEPYIPSSTREGAYGCGANAQQTEKRGVAVSTCIHSTENRRRQDELRKKGAQHRRPIRPNQPLRQQREQNEVVRTKAATARAATRRDQIYHIRRVPIDSRHNKEHSRLPVPCSLCKRHMEK